MPDPIVVSRSGSDMYIAGPDLAERVSDICAQAPAICANSAELADFGAALTNGSTVVIRQYESGPIVQVLDGDGNVLYGVDTSEILPDAADVPLPPSEFDPELDDPFADDSFELPNDPPVDEPSAEQSAAECDFSCKAGAWASAIAKGGYSAWRTIKDAALSVDPEAAAHVALDIGGFVPGIGEFLDAGHAGWYAVEGNYLDAALTILGVIPVVGDVIGKGAKYAMKAGGKALEAWWKAVHEFGGLDAIHSVLDRLGGRVAEKLKNAFGKFFQEAGQKLASEHPGSIVGTIRQKIPLGTQRYPEWPDLPYHKTPTFSSVEPTFIEPGTKLYRVYGPPAGPNGAYWSLTPPPVTEAAWRGPNAVRTDWNSGDRYAVMEVGPQGIKGWAGPAAPQHVVDGVGHQLDGLIYPGGANQIYVPEGQFGSIVDQLPTPWSRR